MTPIENAIAQLGGQAAAAQLFGLAGYQAVQSWWRNNRVPAEYCPRIESLTGVRCEDLNDRVEWSLIRGAAAAASATDHAAQLRAAIKQTRELFASELAASDAMRYLEALLDTNPFFASAAVPAQTGIEPIRLSLFDASKDLLHWIEAKHRAPQHDFCGNMARVRVDALATLADAVAAEEVRRAGLVAAGGANASIAEQTHAGAGAAPVAGPGSSWTINGQASSTHFDQAAAAMAAESAQLLAEAERSVAKKAVAAGLDPLSVLSREVNRLSNKLQLPGELAVQLLILAALRGI